MNISYCENFLTHSLSAIKVPFIKLWPLATLQSYNIFSKKTINHKENSRKSSLIELIYYSRNEK